MPALEMPTPSQVKGVMRSCEKITASPAIHRVWVVTSSPVTPEGMYLPPIVTGT